jgi:hypothetical protein
VESSRNRILDAVARAYSGKFRRRRRRGVGATKRQEELNGKALAKA